MNIVIPTSVFNRQWAVDQAVHAAAIAACGGQGIEIRRELFPSGEELPLEACRSALEPYPLYCVYSAPVNLWQLNGELNVNGLDMVLREARTIGADMVKMPLGHFDASCSDVSALSRRLESYRQDGGKAAALTVENDQTPYGGQLQPMSDFFKAVSEGGIPVRMTFDIGNWAYCGENAFAAAEMLGEHVIYVHCKHVERQGTELKTLPIPLEPEADWRKLLKLLPSDAMRAIEFLLPEDSMLPEFIAKLREEA